MQIDVLVLVLFSPVYKTEIYSKLKKSTHHKYVCVITAWISIAILNALQMVLFNHPFERDKHKLPWKARELLNTLCITNWHSSQVTEAQLSCFIETK